MQENNSPLIASVSMDDISFLIQGKSVSEQIQVLKDYFHFHCDQGVNNSGFETVRVINSDKKHGFFIVDKGFVKFPTKVTAGQSPFFVEKIPLGMGVVTKDGTKIMVICVQIGNKLHAGVVGDDNIFDPITFNEEGEMHTFQSYDELKAGIQTFLMMQGIQKQTEDALILNIQVVPENDQSEDESPKLIH